ncbi:putative methyltransferase-domain-containing protein [Aspergillus egyptiacus]|nr:putative methyltransferase-domain-containing protein [Aspergillus egyptiacus]
MESSSRPVSAGSNDPFHISESLVPVREVKQAGQSHVTFDGLLRRPLLLKEDLKEGCGGQLWPAGMALAKYMLRQHRSNLVNKSIVELGAGGGLVGLAVASGCEIGRSPVYITDQAPMLSLMQTNISLNDLSSTVNAAVLDWGAPIPHFIPKHPDIILAADCVYFEPAFPLLMSTLKELLGPNSVCYFCFKKRRRADFRFIKLAKKEFQMTEVANDPDSETYKRENLFLYSIRTKPGTDGISNGAL